MTYCIHDDPYNDVDGLLEKASHYGKKILRQSSYHTLWAVLITWCDLRPCNAKPFAGVSIQVFLALV